MINKAYVEGNLTFDSIRREHAKSGVFTTFTIANEEYIGKNDDGTDIKHVNFIDCVLFGNRAEAMYKLLTKGTRVIVEGKLRWSQWEKDGVKKSKIELRVEDISLMTKKKPENAQASLADEDIDF